MGFLGKSGGGPTVGVDIGSSLMKVVEARPGKEGPQITALGVCPTPEGVIVDDVILDPESLGRALRQLLAESGIQCKRCVSSVSGQSSVVVRIIEVPKMTKQELAETMKWEVERHVPFAASEVVMDFALIEERSQPQDDQNMEVLLAVAQQDLVNKHVESLLAAGLEPTAIDVEPLAVARALIDSSKNGEREQTIAIVNVGSEATDIGVFQHGLLAFPRSLPIAGKAITRALSDTLNIPFEQAERLKRERGTVLMDRAGQYTPDVGLGSPPRTGVGDEPDATVGLAAPASDSSDEDMSFIPGLGFTSMEEEPAPQQAAGQTADEPSFDIDLGGGVSGTGDAPPAMSFDLSVDEEPAQDSAQAGTPQLDLSGDVQKASDEIAPAAPPAPVSDQGSEVEIPAYSDEVIFDAIGPVLADLVAEVRRSIEYFASRYQSQPDKIVLCGGTAKLPHLDEFFTAELGIPTIVANPLKNIEVFSRGASEDYLAEVAAVFPVGIGLAMRDMIGE